MKKAEILSKKTCIEDIVEYIKMGRVFVMPYGLNRSVYVIINHNPQHVMVTDISVKGIQLNGAWISWEKLDEDGGIYESEFEALTAIAERGL